MSQESLWSGFAHDPRDPAHADLRASDADRERVRVLLADAFADGRLDREEYDERSASLLSTRTLGQLPALVVDLVGPQTGLPTPPGPGPTRASAADLQARARRTWEAQRRGAVFGFLGPTLICWAIWVAIGFGPDGFEGGFPWPLIVTVVTGLNLARTFASRTEILEIELRRLERRQRQAIDQGPDRSERPDRDE